MALQTAHDSLLGGHFGAQKTFDLLARSYFMPKMFYKVKEYVQSCKTCQKFKVPRKQQAGQFHSIPLQEVQKAWCVDFLGPWKSLTKKRLVYIIVAMDTASRYAETKAVHNNTTKELATFLLENIVCRHGQFNQIISDLGSAFISQAMDDMLKALKVEKITTSAYVHHSNPAERVIQTLENLLAPYVNDEHTNWPELLPILTHT